MGGGGSVYAYEHTAQGYVLDQKLTEGAASGSNHLFGYSVALDGDRLIVGAANSSLGRAYVFDRSSNGWLHEATLLPPTGYRDPLGPCGQPSNTTNAIAVTFAPW
ncbi:MAG: hypothetical protein GY711_11250 [bacterium]|nr:hypothetical protein [bacterium]